MSSTEKELSAIVQKGLEMMTERVGHASRLDHATDRGAVAEMLAILRKNGEVFTARAIGNWCREKGWPNQGADWVEDIAEAVLLLSEPIGPRHWSQDIMDILRQEAKSGQSPNNQNEGEQM